MKVLLTGQEGNFGSRFQKLLGSDKVVGLGRNDWSAVDDKFASGVDVVVHAASDLHGSVGVQPTSVLSSNIGSTARLLEASRRHGIRRFVFLSTCAVYGEDMQTGETSSAHPISINGISKLLNEKVVAEFCQTAGIEYQILRIFNMYGGADRFSILARLRACISSGQIFTLNNGGMAQRDFVHVDDVAAITQKLVGTKLAFSHLNVGTGVATKISSLVSMALQVCPDLKIVSEQREEAEYSRADIRRLSTIFKFSFTPVEKYASRVFAEALAERRSVL